MATRRTVRSPGVLTSALGAAALGVVATGCGGGGECAPEPGTICTMAGTGVAGLSDDGAPPLETEFYLPQDLTIGPDGRPYILDWNNHRVRTIRDDAVHTLIGTGELGDAPDGRGTEIRLNHPTHVAFSPDGQIIVSAWHNSKVLRYNPSTELVQTICGTGTRSFNGDGQPGPETVLDLPVATSFAPDGTLYISDQANQRIRALGSDEVVTTVVGTGEPGYSGDGGPAIEAQIHLPVSQSAPPAGRIAASSDGTLYLADTLNHVIRRIDPDGIITTIAGTGEPGNGPSGLATEGALDMPADVDVDAEGNVYIADTMNSCVRKVDTNGEMWTVAGVCGELGYEGDGGAASEALLNRPYGIALDGNGALYIVDTHNQVIRVAYGAS